MPREILQDRYAPESVCFGCGPANADGLRIKSRVRGRELVSSWSPKPHHHAFEGCLSGGIIATLLDCHSNWAAAYELMRRSGADELPATVTASISVQFLRPTPMDRPLTLRAGVSELSGRKVVVRGSLEASGEATATSLGTFVAVPAGHPAFHRWSKAKGADG